MSYCHPAPATCLVALQALRLLPPYGRCHKGHLLSPANVSFSGTHKWCRKCKSERNRAYRAAQKQQAA